MATGPSKYICAGGAPPSSLSKEMKISVITMREPIGLSLEMSPNRAVRPERSLPFLPPGLSPTSRICASRSMSPALRRALAAIVLLPGAGADAEKRDMLVQRGRLMRLSSVRVVVWE